MTIPIMALLITTLLIMKILITLNMVDITYKVLGGLGRARKVPIAR